MDGDDEVIESEQVSTVTTVSGGELKRGLFKEEPDFDEHEVSASSNKYESGDTPCTATVNVQEEVEMDETTANILLGIGRPFTLADSSQYFDALRSRGRPRGPKHPVWNFYKFYKSGGVTLGYMCLLCRSDFTGPANTTNASKHLRCRHKCEFLLYLEMLEGSKQGTFMGNIHEAIRELVTSSRAKRANDGLIGLADPLMGERQLPLKRSKLSYFPFADSSETDLWSDIDLEAKMRASLQASPSSPVSSKVSESQPEVSSTLSSFLLRPGSLDLTDTVGTKSSSGGSESKIRGRMMQCLSDADGVGSEFAEHMESFIRDYRRLEAECHELRTEVSEKDEQIASLRLRLLEEQNRRRSALILVQRALLDDSHD